MKTNEEVSDVDDIAAVLEFGRARVDRLGDSNAARGA